MLIYVPVPALPSPRCSESVTRPERLTPRRPVLRAGPWDPGGSPGSPPQDTAQAGGGAGASPRWQRGGPCSHLPWALCHPGDPLCSPTGDHRRGGEQGGLSCPLPQRLWEDEGPRHLCPLPGRPGWLPSSHGDRGPMSEADAQSAPVPSPLPLSHCPEEPASAADGSLWGLIHPKPAGLSGTAPR